MNYNISEVIKTWLITKQFRRIYDCWRSRQKNGGYRSRPANTDREGLFCPSAVSEGGRRLYSDKDIIKLQPNIIVKVFGVFDRQNQKQTDPSIDTPDEVAAALTEQSKAIRAQIETLTQSLRDIETLKTEVLKMQSVDFKKYADIIVNLQCATTTIG